MDEYEYDDYDDDYRNAREHRAGGSGGRTTGRYPARRPPPPSGAPVYHGRAPARAPVYQAEPVYQPAYGYGTPILNPGAIGTLLKAAIPLLASVLGLPAAPTIPAATGDPATDGKNALIAQSNLVAYQTALAQAAKRDEMIRAFGDIAVVAAGGFSAGAVS